MLDATRLHPLLYIGSAPIGGPSVAAAGFQVLVLCAEEFQPRGRDFPGVHVIHAPFDDAVDLSEREVETIYSAAEAVAGHVARGRRTLVTCMAGRNRSAVVCGLALHLLTNESGQRIARRIRRRRVGADGGKALANPLFFAMLRDLPAAVPQSA